MTAAAYQPAEQPCTCDCQAKLSAVAAIIQNPNFTHKQARIRTASVLALEAQRPKDDPGTAFRVDLGDLAKRAGLIPPTPREDEEAGRKAYRSGRKQAGQALKELADAGAFEQYIHEPERDAGGTMRASSVILQTSAPHLELIRIAGRMGGTRKLQQPRGPAAKIDPRCPECGSSDTRLQCRACGAVTHTSDLSSAVTASRDRPAPDMSTDFQRLEPGEELPSPPQTPGHGPVPPTDLQPLETLYTKTQGESASTDFQSLEVGQSPSPEVDPPAEPNWLPPCPGMIPQQLLDCRQWVIWKPQPPGPRKRRWGKPPHNPRTGYPGSKTDPADWGSFAEALEGLALDGARGLGVCLTKQAGIRAGDIDGCRDAVTGLIQPWAMEIVRMVPTYWELSPSGEGLRSFFVGELPDGSPCFWKMDGHRIEVHGAGDFMTVTGHHLEGTPVTIRDCTTEMAALWERCDGPKRPPPVSSNGHRAHRESDQELLERAHAARNGAKFAALMRGDWAGYPSQSEADLALCRMLGFWGADQDQIDQLFRQSGLYRAKWDEVHRGNGETYGRTTIELALSGGLS